MKNIGNKIADISISIGKGLWDIVKLSDLNFVDEGVEAKRDISLNKNDVELEEIELNSIDQVKFEEVEKGVYKLKAGEVFEDKDTPLFSPSYIPSSDSLTNVLILSP